MNFSKVPIEVFLDNILPCLKYSEVQKLAATCKAMNDYLNCYCVWNAIVKQYQIPWKDQEFLDQDPGTTSIRMLLSERMKELDKYKRIDRLDDGSEVEVLVDPKGLLQDVAQFTLLSYAIIDRGYVD